MKSILESLLAIESQTGNEAEKVAFISSYINQYIPNSNLIHHRDSLCITINPDPTKKTVALVGHSDVVPQHVTPSVKQNRIYGSGASDMQASLAVYLDILRRYHQALRYTICLIIYAREEGTALVDNGLYDLIQTEPAVFKQIDCAIVGEPTDNTVQLGCLGSLHMTVKIRGKASHSARPWHGENALYKARPLIDKIASQSPRDVIVKELRFKESMSITECWVTEGRTTIPEMFTANINYRFGPDKTSNEAVAYLESLLETLSIEGLTWEVRDVVPSGSIVRSSMMDDMIREIDQPIEAKQAWTDVAQLSALGIPCFNFGPGHQAQAHKPDEYVDWRYVEAYYKIIKRIVVKES